MSTRSRTAPLIFGARATTTRQSWSDMPAKKKGRAPKGKPAARKRATAVGESFAVDLAALHERTFDTSAERYAAVRDLIHRGAARKAMAETIGVSLSRIGEIVRREEKRRRRVDVESG
jgi:hypothetical protein